MPDPTTVTMPVEELAKLVKHAEQSLFWYSLPRDPETHQYHRCLSITFLTTDGGTQIRFELQENHRIVESVTHKLDDIFRLLPRLAVFLAEQKAPV